MWKITLPEEPLSAEEWCQLASDLRAAYRRGDNVVRLAITCEMDDGSRLTFEHDERLRELDFHG